MHISDVPLVNERFLVEICFAGMDFDPGDSVVDASVRSHVADVMKLEMGTEERGRTRFFDLHLLE